MSSELAFNIIILIIGYSIVVSSLEALFTRRMFQAKNILDWSQLRFINKRFNHPIARAIFEKYLNVSMLLWSRLFFSLALIFFVINHWDIRWIIYPLLVINVSFNMRSYYTNNGADQVTNIILMAIAIAFFDPSKTFLKPISLNFIAIEISIGYFTSGFLKLNKGWLNGYFLIEVMSTNIYGHKQVYKLLKNRQKLSALLSILMILLELMLAFAFLFPPTMCIIILSLGILFHLSIAIFMGLNGFLTAFSATYPAILFTSIHGIIIPTIKF